jgi:hypothetical protein
MRQKIILALFFIFIACIGIFPPLKKDEKTMGRGFVLSKHLYQHDYTEWNDKETGGTRFVFSQVDIDLAKMLAEVISLIGIFGVYLTLTAKQKKLRTN